MGKGSANKASTSLGNEANVAPQQLSLANQQQNLGTGFAGQGAQNLTQAGNTYSGIANGNVQGIQNYVAPQISAATNQFQQARKQIQSTGPGAARDAALRNLAVTQAGTNTGIYSGGVASALQGLTGVGATQGGLGTQNLAGAGQNLMGASATYGNVGQMYNMMSANKGNQAMQGVGDLTSGAMRL